MLLLPMDKWFGTFHDGSMEAHEEMKSRRRASVKAGDDVQLAESLRGAEPERGQGAETAGD